jgi:hypothetical protein
MPTSNPHPTPQKRHGVFFHVGPNVRFVGRGPSAGSARSGTTADAAVAAETTAAFLRNVLRSTDLIEACLAGSALPCPPSWIEGKVATYARGKAMKPFGKNDEDFFITRSDAVRSHEL